MERFSIARLVKHLLYPPFFYLGAIHPKLRQGFNYFLYQLIAGKFSDGLNEFDFLNFGYTPLDSDAEVLALEGEDEANRLNIQLYHHLASAAPVQGRAILEVGCGHGGGASYVTRCFKPDRMVGVDLSENNIRLCRERHNIHGLSFQTADAQNLPFLDGEFDVVLNVESSHCYPSMKKFLDEVCRVLRPGGHFLIADLRPTGRLPEVREQFKDSGLRIHREENITENVLRARDQFTSQAEARIKASMKVLGEFALAFLGAQGTETYEKLKSGRHTYFAFFAQKD